MKFPGFAILGDSELVVENRVTGGKRMRAKKRNETMGIPESEQMAEIDIILQCLMPSERRTAEWEIGAVKSPFG